MRENVFVLGLVLGCSLAPLSFAQEGAKKEGAMQAPAPSPTLAKFANLIGTFEGEGTMLMEAGGKPGAWTGKAVGTSILGGHAIQFDETLTTPMGPMEFRTIYGYDAESKKPTSFWVTPMGVQENEFAWIDEDTILGVDHGFHEGKAYAHRWTQDITKDGYAFTMDTFSGDGPAFQHAVGKMRRTSSTAPAKSAREAGASKPQAELEPLAPMIGTWSMTAHINMHGMEMDVAGKETLEWAFGGTAIAGHIVGEPGGYECDWYVAWDPAASRFRHAYVSNHGEIGMSDGWLVDGKFVTTTANSQAGVPGVERTVVEFNKDGIQHVYSDRISGAGATVRSFDAKYQRAAQGANVEAGTAGAGAGKVAALQGKLKDGSCCSKAIAAGKTCTHPCCVEAAKGGQYCPGCNS